MCLEELKLHVPRAELLPGIELLTADRIDVDARAGRLAESKHLVLRFERHVDNEARRRDDARADAKVVADVYHRTVNVLEQVVPGRHHRLLDDVKAFLEMRSKTVSLAQLGDQLATVKVGRHHTVPNV